MHYLETQPPSIEAKGIDELNLKLEVPFGESNPGDFIIRNEGRHVVVGYRVAVEGHLKNGETALWYTSLIQPLAMKENEAERKPEYLTTAYGCIPPKEAVFWGLKRQVRPIEGNDIPKLERVWFPGPSQNAYARIVVRLDGVLLEDGQMYGPNTQLLRDNIDEIMTDQTGLPASYGGGEGGSDEAEQ